MKYWMDLTVEIHLIIVFLMKLLELTYSSDLDLASTKIYSLARDCRVFDTSDYPMKRKLLLSNFTGIQLNSHEFYLPNDTNRRFMTTSNDYQSLENYNSEQQQQQKQQQQQQQHQQQLRQKSQYQYPEKFLCEITAKAHSNSRIMMRIDSFYIPAHNYLCDENYLYVFDHRSSLSKAMDVAGGENGLCNRNYPKFPIFTTGPYITLVFKSTIQNQIIKNNPGFRIYLTEIKSINTKDDCDTNYFKCGPVEQMILSNSHKPYRRHYQRDLSKYPIAMVTQPQKIITQRLLGVEPIVSYCILRDLVCDSFNNCHNGLDESPRSYKFCLRSNKLFEVDKDDLDTLNAGILTRFLSLGLSAAIAIAVSLIIAMTFCVAVTVCSFMRVCTSLSNVRASAYTHQNSAHANSTRFTKGVILVSSNHKHYLSSSSAASSSVVGAGGCGSSHLSSSYIQHNNNNNSTGSPSNNNSSNTHLHGHTHHLRQPNNKQNNPQLACFRATSPSTSNSEKLYHRMYVDNNSGSNQQASLNCNYSGNMRPSSEKLGHWASSSIVSYPSSADDHHSHPETPYFNRNSNYYDPNTKMTSNHSQKSSQLIDISTGETNTNNNANNISIISTSQPQQYHIQTPSSSRSAKSTRSTKSSNIIDKKHRSNMSSQVASGQDRIRMLGPVIGEV